MKYIFLTPQFYSDYDYCGEMEKKVTRPYVQVQITINGIDFAIPLRSNIEHSHVLWTDKAKKCGLDFSKAVVIEDIKYIDTTKKPYIRQNEYKELMGKEYIIKQKMLRYIEKYKKAKMHQESKHNHYLCKFSTLQYFEKYI